MTTQTKDLWSLVLDHSHIDPQELTDAMVDQVLRGDLDFRSRLLIRDSLNALRDYWGPQRLDRWLEAVPVRERLEAIQREDLGRVGFPFLGDQLMKPNRPQQIPES